MLASIQVGQPQQLLREFSLSPNGRFVATTVAEPADIWIQDLARSTVSRLTFEARGEWIPGWSNSGREVAYTLQAESGDTHRLLKKSANAQN